MTAVLLGMVTLAGGVEPQNRPARGKNNIALLNTNTNNMTTAVRGHSGSEV